MDAADIAVGEGAQAEERQGVITCKDVTPRSGGSVRGDARRALGKQSGARANGA